MKKTFVFFTFLAVLCMVFISCADYEEIAEFRNTVYPLSEYNFKDGAEWMVIICEDVYENDGEYYMCDNEDVLEKNKNKLVVNAVSETLADFSEDLVWIYKNGQLVKSVPCLEYEFLRDSFERDFVEMSYEKVASFINLDF